VSTDEGNTIDREAVINLVIYDFHAALDRGESPNRSEWVARYPDLDPELKAYFDDLDQLLPAVSTKDYRGVPPQRSASDDHPGDALGDYILLEELGRGGQGVVWKAHPRHSPETVVALKTLATPSVCDEASIHRLRVDARTIARMDHPNIIKTYYYGEDRGRWFYVMELMKGETVASRIKSYTADLRASVVLLEKVARAIHHAHTGNPGVLHLDLKPGNILLTSDGDPRVADFGLSIRLETLERSDKSDGFGASESSDATDDVTATYARAGIVGTIPYISPEMAAGRWADISTSSDIYGLGAILYAMLTGQAPFKSGDQRATLDLVIEGKLVPPRNLNREVDQELQAVCLKCLHKDPALRYGSADALANDLKRWISLEPTLAGKPTVLKHVWYWFRRHPARVAIACLVALVSWIAAVAGALPGLHEANAQDADRLAREINGKIRMIKRAVTRSAESPVLVAAFHRAKVKPDELRGTLDSFLRETTDDFNYRFDLTGGSPLYNVYLLDPKGVLLVDTHPGKTWLGENFSGRDYFQGLSRIPTNIKRGEESVYVSRVYNSVKDNHYKIALAARVWDGSECVGILVANISISRKLIDLEMSDEPLGAMVVSPFDPNSPNPESSQAEQIPKYIRALDRNNPDEGLTASWIDADRFPGMMRFEDPEVSVVSEHFLGGSAVDYCRVAGTSMVVVLQRPYPLATRFFLDPRLRLWTVAILAVLALLPVTKIAVRHLPIETQPKPPRARGTTSTG
jgi:eukaryotic-like serine/threonine-protein kinase